MLAGEVRLRVVEAPRTSVPAARSSTRPRLCARLGRRVRVGATFYDSLPRPPLVVGVGEGWPTGRARRLTVEIDRWLRVALELLDDRRELEPALERVLPARAAGHAASDRRRVIASRSMVICSWRAMGVTVADAVVVGFGSGT